MIYLAPKVSFFFTITSVVLYKSDWNRRKRHTVNAIWGTNSICMHIHILDLLGNKQMMIQLQISSLIFKLLTIDCCISYPHTKWNQPMCRFRWKRNSTSWWGKSSISFFTLCGICHISRTMGFIVEVTSPMLMVMPCCWNSWLFSALLKKNALQDTWNRNTLRKVVTNQHAYKWCCQLVS